MDLDRLARAQHGVLSRDQAIRELTPEQVRWRLQRGWWQVVHPGVYQVHTAPLQWMARASAALLHYGPGAMLSHQSAAYLLGIDDAAPPLIHVDLPHAVRRERVMGTRVRRRRALPESVIRRGLPTTNAAAVVVDLGDEASATREDAVAIAARAVQRRKVTVADIASELERRGRHRHRLALHLALGIVADGAESGLEVDFAVGVLRAHGLPRMTMAAPDVGLTGRIRRDFLDEEHGVVVEADGRLGHEGAARRSDNRRDRRTAASGRVTLRTDWVEVHFDRCALARDVADTLRARGWRGQIRPCGPSCRAARHPARGSPVSLDGPPPRRR